MGGEALYERYKDALKRGHVASLRGELDVALDAYAEASRIAPERPAPHTSAGTALLRRGRPVEALRYYDLALRLAPRDEAALLGRAQALVALGRRPEAADTFDALAEARLANGHLAEAVDAARRGLELAEGRERRRTLERLLERLRASEPDEPGRAALERALVALEGPAVGAPRDGRQAPGVEGAASGEDVPGPETPPDADAATGAAGAPPPAPRRRALDRELPPDAGPDELARRCEVAADAGDAAEAVERLLDLAAATRNQGRPHAAMDACYAALSHAPDDVDLHLALVELYEEQGWVGLATEKLDLLERLVVLEDDHEGMERVAAARSGLP
jgi:tetratricopeptide (TPR) repeat protein